MTKLADEDIIVDEEELKEESEEKEESESEEESEEKEESESEEESEEKEESESEEESEGLTISIDEEDSPSGPSSVIRKLRHEHRKLQQKAKKLEAELAKTKDSKSTVLGPKPKMADFDFDSDKYEQALEEWHEQKKVVDKKAEKEKQAAQEAAKVWEQHYDNYKKKASSLGVADFEEAEESVKTDLSEIQQGLIIQGAENPALVVYALGKNPAKAQQLASITDPVKFSFAIAKLEEKIKVNKTKTAPKPDKKVAGSGGGVSSSKTLDRLREEADKTGDYTKVVAFKKKMREQKK